MALYQIVALHLLSAAGTDRAGRTQSSEFSVQVNATRLEHAISFAAKACEYVEPRKVPESQCYHNPVECERLTDAEWVADIGDADGKHVLFFAYGPKQEGYKQIPAWKYNEGREVVDFWWSKAGCMGMTSTGCTEGSKGNIPSFASNSQLNPSAGFTSKKFREGDDIQFSNFGTFKLLKTEERGWKLQIEDKECYVDHIYVCDKSSYVLRSKDSRGALCNSAHEAPEHPEDSHDDDSPEDSPEHPEGSHEGSSAASHGNHPVTLNCPPCQCQVTLRKAVQEEDALDKLHMYIYPLYISCVALVTLGLSRRCGLF